MACSLLDFSFATGMVEASVVTDDGPEDLCDKVGRNHERSGCKAKVIILLYIDKIIALKIGPVAVVNGASVLNYFIEDFMISLCFCCFSFFSLATVGSIRASLLVTTSLVSSFSTVMTLLAISIAHHFILVISFVLVLLVSLTLLKASWVVLVTRSLFGRPLRQFEYLAFLDKEGVAEELFGHVCSDRLLDILLIVKSPCLNRPLKLLRSIELDNNGAILSQVLRVKLSPYLIALVVTRTTLSRTLIRLRFILFVLFFMTESRNREEELRVAAATELVSGKNSDTTEGLLAMDPLPIEPEHGTVGLFIVPIAYCNLDLEGLLLIDADIVLCCLVSESHAAIVGLIFVVWSTIATCLWLLLLFANDFNLHAATMSNFCVVFDLPYTFL